MEQRFLGNSGLSVVGAQLRDDDEWRAGSLREDGESRPGRNRPHPRHPPRRRGHDTRHGGRLFRRRREEVLGQALKGRRRRVRPRRPGRTSGCSRVHSAPAVAEIPDLGVRGGPATAADRLPRPRICATSPTCRAARGDAARATRTWSLESFHRPASNSQASSHFSLPAAAPPNSTIRSPRGRRRPSARRSSAVTESRQRPSTARPQFRQMAWRPPSGLIHGQIAAESRAPVSVSSRTRAPCPTARLRQSRENAIARRTPTSRRTSSRCCRRRATCCRRRPARAWSTRHRRLNDRARAGGWSTGAWAATDVTAAASRIAVEWISWAKLSARPAFALKRSGSVTHRARDERSPAAVRRCHRSFLALSSAMNWAMRCSSTGSGTEPIARMAS